MKNQPASLALSLLLAFGLLAHARAETALEQARAAFAQKDLATAETLLTPLVTADAPDAAACYQLGLVRQQQNRFEEAVDLFEKATRRDATQAEYFASLGLAASQRMSQVGMMKGAMLAMKMKKAWTQALELDPQNISSLIGLARYHTNAPAIAGGSMEKSREFAARLKQIHPFLGELEFGTIAEHFEDYAAAATHYQAAAQLAPKNLHAQTSAARVLAKLGRKDDARTHLNAALQIDPAHAAAQKALAEL